MVHGIVSFEITLLTIIRLLDFYIKFDIVKSVRYIVHTEGLQVIIS